MECLKPYIRISFLGFSEWSNLGSFSRQSLGFTGILSHFLIIVYVDTHMSIFFFSFLLSNCLIELMFLPGKLWSQEYSGLYIWAAKNWKPCICSILQWKCSADNSGYPCTWCCAPFASLLFSNGWEDIPALFYWGILHLKSILLPASLFFTVDTALAGLMSIWALKPHCRCCA